MVTHLSTPTVVAPMVNEVMQYIQTDRRMYVDTHKGAFKTVKVCCGLMGQVVGTHKRVSCHQAQPAFAFGLMGTLARIAEIRLFAHGLRGAHPFIGV